MHKHFDKIADDYNEIWAFTPGYQAFMLNAIVDGLDFKTTDQFVDIGGGTGTYTHQIAEYKSLKPKPICVEPSAPMAQKAAENNALSVLCEDAEAFVKRDLVFDKVLFKEVTHHIEHRPVVWQGLYQHLNADGKVLIVTRPREVKIPFFAAAKQAFYDNQPDAQIWVDELTAAGFSVEMQLKKLAFSLSKEQWYKMLRKRFMSDLGKFSDIEIEAGILELQRTYPQQDWVPVEEQLILIVATKER